MERARFGIFDFDPSTGDLRRNGVAVRLQAQPARVLGALVLQAGQVVTRETLQREVWGEGTHVDFERGLNFCIAQVRSALGDSAESPRYIETVPKQGYRFIAPVAAAPESAMPAAPAGPLPEPDISVAGREAPRHVRSGVRRSRQWLALAATAAGLIVAASLVWARMLDAQPTVVVVPFYNETGRPDLDRLARSMGDGLVASLATPERIRALSVIGNAPALRNPFARQDVQQIARDLGAEWVLIGQLETDGDGLRVIAHLIRASDMKHLWARPYDDSTFALDAQSRTAEAIAAAVTDTLTASR